MLVSCIRTIAAPPTGICLSRKSQIRVPDHRERKDVPWLLFEHMSVALIDQSNDLLDGGRFVYAATMYDDLRKQSEQPTTRELTEEPWMIGRATSNVITRAVNSAHTGMGLSTWHRTSPALKQSI